MAKSKKPIERSIAKLPNLAPAPQPKKLTFHQFFAVWANIQGWSIPKIHFEIIDYLNNADQWENRTGVLQIFRGAGKSTIVGLFIVWQLTQDPTQSFLIVSSNDEMARRMSADVMGIVARHPFAAHLNAGDSTWRDGHLFVNGHTDHRAPSVKARSIEASMTGSRAHWIIYDDTEDSENVHTDHRRAELRRKLHETTWFRHPSVSKELFIGTPHTWDSIYPEILGESGKEHPFRSGASGLKIPIMTDVSGEFPNMVGTPTNPERFPIEEILKMQREAGTKGNFLSQALLVPDKPKDTVLDPTLIALYDHELDVHRANGGMLAKIGDVRMVGVKAFWDPAMSGEKGDDSVLSIVFSTDDGFSYIHRAVGLKGTPQAQAESAIEILKDCSVTHVIIETNGVGAAFPSIFRERAAGKGISYEARATNINKATKIIHAFEARLAGGFIYAHKSVMEGPFRTQLRDFSPKKMGRTKDDYIDSVASAILAEPFRLKSGHYGSRGQSWQHNGGSVEVPMDDLTF